MKILLATDTYYPNVDGASYFTQRLAQALTLKGHHVFVIAPSESFADAISDVKGVTVYWIRSMPVPWYPHRRWSPLWFTSSPIRRAVYEIAPDIIHVQNHFMIGRRVVEAAKHFHIPVMGTNHFMPENLVYYFRCPKFAERRFVECLWRQFIKVYQQLDLVTTPTITAVNLLKKIGFTKEAMVISCGIDLERFNPNNDGAYLKQRYGVPSDRPILLYVGRMDKEKRADTILRAMPLASRDIDVHLVLAGIGRERLNLDVMARELGIRDAVTFTNFVPDDDLPNLYKIADVFVIAGIAELQSLVTMEAMASGLPIVAVNAMALPELVHDGENGFLFPEDNSQALADRLVAILTDESLKKRMGERSLAIIEKHDLRRVVDTFESAYRSVLGQHPYMQVATTLKLQE